MALDPKKAIADIKKLLFGDEPAPAPAPAPMAAVEYKLQDGTAVSIDKLEVGGVVTIAGAVAPDGEYCLEDGTCITVAVGVISAVTPPAAAEPVAEEMKTPVQMQAALNKFADDVVAGGTPDIKKMAIILKACFEYSFGWQLREASEKDTRDAAIATYQAGFTKMEKELANHKEANKLLLELVEAFSEESKEAPAETPKDWEAMSALEKRRFLKQTEK